ncbi:hypothetical protein LR48_Vigan284s002300 [Vigna angularis]|uniref:Uncharacterized protein n=1 Tax=Phaseolus angularis TaxID=3914 RepID=A0A0L9T7I5_PHAAN|nr:hypothetical protein LR48_Vigan284s002300 [Vigna angularis]
MTSARWGDYERTLRMRRNNERSLGTSVRLGRLWSPNGPSKKWQDGRLERRHMTNVQKGLNNVITGAGDVVVVIVVEDDVEEKFKEGVRGKQTQPYALIEHNFIQLSADIRQTYIEHVPNNYREREPGLPDGHQDIRMELKEMKSRSIGKSGSDTLFFYDA